MAKIVLGLGTSHTPMLLADDATLERFVETDQKIKHRDKEGRPATYGDLLEKADPKMAHMVAPEHLVARQNVARDAIKRVAQTLASSSVDALIVLGDDQNESYKEDCRPAFAIYYGDTIRNSNEQHEEYRKRFPEWYVQNRQGFFEDEGPRDYPVHAGLAVHLLESLMDAGFDMAGSQFGVMLFPDMPRGIREMARVVRSGGRVLMIAYGDPHEIEFLGFLVAAIRCVRPDFEGPPMDPPPLPFQLRSPDRLRDELAAARLRDIGVETITEVTEFDSGAALWDWLVSSNPIVEIILAGLALDNDERGEVGRSLDTMVRDRAGGAATAKLFNPVHIGIGTK